MSQRTRLRPRLQEMTAALESMSQFWLDRALSTHGTFQSRFDAHGHVIASSTLHLVAQSRVLWTASALEERFPGRGFAEIARTGLQPMYDRLWDAAEDGWFWTARHDGTVLDPAKIMYGQSFALYGLVEAARVLHEPLAQELAEATFDAIQRGIDTEFGGYLENLDRHWQPEDSVSGQRKSLDIHLHLLESFTTLARLTRAPVHRRRLAEVRSLILERMVDATTGAGGNQYARDFTPLVPVVIDRTWVSDRTASASSPAMMTTSYGHNVELGWLLGVAETILGDPDPAAHRDLVTRITRHALRHGYDSQHGGFYREGTPGGDATDLDKEFWQNAEALVGLLHAFETTGDEQALDAFETTWDFASRFLVHPTLGEWRIRTDRTGSTLDATLGNDWTGGYHTVRAMLECTSRLRRLVVDDS